MKSVPNISLSPLTGTTPFAPLAAIGSAMRTTDSLSPLYSRLAFSHKTHTDRPVETLVDLWVSILAGCRSVRQINTKTRADLTLARSWGRQQFAEQSTVARVLDSCEAEQAAQLREGVNNLFRWMNQTPRHKWRTPLLIDIDLTGLPAGGLAVGSTKGYFQKKGGEVANSVELALSPMMKRLAPGCILAIP